jgi:LacI family transcriptional regulator
MPAKNSNAKIPAVTMRDVAKACGVSPATVSIVFNGAPLSRYIAAETKEKVRKAVESLGYRPNAAARFLRNNRSQTVGVILFDITDAFCTPILRGIGDALYDVSHVPMITDTLNRPDRFERYLEMMLERQVEGLIVIANWLFMDINLLGDMAKRKIPVVTIGWESERETLSSVMVDNEAGVRLALEHLYVLGHRKIAFIRGPKTIADSEARWSAAVKFAKSAGLEIDSNLVVSLPEARDPNSAFDHALTMTERLLKKKSRFTALMTFDDTTAFGAMRALHNAGVRVPDDCSVVGFDDVAAATTITPGLTTVHQPLERMGQMAVSIVMDAVKATREKRPQPVVQHKLIPSLTVRGSTQAARPQ